MEQRLTQLALVTGGAHPMGIGFATAKSLVKLGYAVIVTGISDAEIALTPALPGVTARIMDVTDGASVAAVIADLPRLDALVNCAGTASMGEFEIAGFQRTIDVNLVGTMRVSMAAHPLLARQGGAVVNIGSMYSIFGSTIAPGYAASKGGVVQLTKSFAASWAKDGIRVNAVAPGWIKTGLSRMLWEDDTAAAPIAARTPMGRWGDPQELGDVIGFLCAPESRFVTGALIPVDGGYSIAG
jgi:NAD(P)-dependent dehydrogenase (short-subunit alcohol dehydrogenase family)